MRSRSVVCTAMRTLASRSSTIIRTLSAFAILVTPSACSHGAYRPARIGDVNAKIVAIVWPSVYTSALTPQSWRASPWYRLHDDEVTPWRVIIAVDRSACVEYDGDVSDPRATEAYVCKSAWRYARAR